MSILKTYEVEATIIVEKKVALKLQARDPQSAIRRATILIHAEDDRVKEFYSDIEIEDIGVQNEWGEAHE